MIKAMHIITLLLGCNQRLTPNIKYTDVDTSLLRTITSTHLIIKPPMLLKRTTLIPNQNVC